MLRTEIDYTTAEMVARQLNWDSSMRLTAAASAGNTQIALSSILQGVTVGSSLCVDFNGSNAETVTVQGINGQTVTCTPLAYAHIIQAPVADITQLQIQISPASRWFDNIMWLPAGFGYEAVESEILSGISRGCEVIIRLSKPHVEIQDVTSVQLLRPQASVLSVAQAYITDEYTLHVPCFSPFGDILAEVTYSGGYNPLPMDIQHATTVIAARMFRARNSGYADAIASDATGTFAYTKEIPNEVKMLIPRYRRRTF